jgi:hypothetical protein
MNSLIDCLSCGRYSSGRDEGYFIVSNLSDVCAKIIPPWHALRFFLFAPFLPPLMKCIRGGEKKGGKKIFNKYPLVGAKKQDYLDFVKVAELVKNKARPPLSPPPLKVGGREGGPEEGLNQIIKIKSGMNKGRETFIKDL